jgi:UDP-N-acetylmuramyl pentapeptide phosphotransferase/UDP-N-acetylglucosamine-1-phosphate transferase
MNPLVAIPFSVFLGVGIINTINLIDGVDGYSSGYGMMACVCFALAFRSVWSPIMVCMTLIMIAALLPFFLHNVFGKKSRMFIGDGGALMLGMMLVVLTFCAMSSKGRVSGLSDSGMCVAAYLSAVGSIPLFDTIRVMTMRILRGRSPFSPDKTHLHHLFVDMGFSHIGAALSILFINIIVILMWLLSWKLGFSFEVQMYVVYFWGILMTFGFYKFMKIQQNNGPKDENGVPQGTALWRIMCKLGSMSHREKNASWRFMQNLVDGPLLIGKR